MQVKLWSQPPSTSEQIPSKLSLCLGLPVMIRYNEATDLCMTHGQEARVVGWTALKLPKWQARRVLDTFYVELQNPPRGVKLPHLPKNVVPITPNVDTIEAQLPNDEYVTVARKQVPILPNFAMTDYSAQGKTREYNVVDIANCRNFHGVYTCLSRGTTLARTIILRDFPDNLLTGTLEGELRQEYRELDYLTLITDLVYQDILPDGILKSTRWDTIATYRTWKNTAGRAVDLAPLLPAEDDMAPPTHVTVFQHETFCAAQKRKAGEGLVNPVPTKKARAAPLPTLANASWAAPVGPLWDAADWSCAFDVWTFILHTLWMSDRVKWSRVMRKVSAMFADLVDTMERMPNLDPDKELGTVRDALRRALRSSNPREYPVGQVGADVMSVTTDMFGYIYRGTLVEVACNSCGERKEISANFCAKLGPFAAVRRSCSVKDYVAKCFRSLGDCVACDSGELLAVHSHSDFICLEVAEAGGVTLDNRVDVPGWGMY